MRIYADSSFLASTYLIDLHSAEVHRRMSLRPQLLITPFHEAELASAIFQQVFQKKLLLTQAQAAYAAFEADRDGAIYLQIAYPSNSYFRSAALAKLHAPTLGVRALDSLHVAAALELKADRFWTFDQRQARLAEAEGLQTK